MQEAEQLYPRRPAPGGGLPLAGEAVLSHRIEMAQVSVGPAEQTQCVGDILHADVLRLCRRGVKAVRVKGIDADQSVFHKPSLPVCDIICIIPYSAQLWQ